MILGLLGVMVVALAGCEQKLQPGETYHKLSVAWPLFDVEKTAGVESGVRWEKEKGDAAFWLATWDKTRKFDNGDTVVYRKERKTFIPFYNAEVEETPQYIKTWGSVLFYPYSSYDKEGAGAPAAKK
jgi:hypothetical protein